MNILAWWKSNVSALKVELMAIYLASRHSGTPVYARLVALLVVGYAFSPIDLIPDPIPVLGILDDAILLPLGIILVRRLIPGTILEECREQARTSQQGRPASRIAAIVIVILWMVAFILVGWYASRWF